MSYRDQFTNNLNCLLVSEYQCNVCGFAFLSSHRVGELSCPSCGGPLEAGKPLVIAQTECKHDYQTHGHSTTI